MRLLRGKVLCGFIELFDGSFGCPDTPKPYPRITPSKVGTVLLPFPCPHCGEVYSEPVDAKKRAQYTDKKRGFQWCPVCQKRYFVDDKGMDLIEPLEPGALGAPAKVFRGDKKVDTLRPRKHDGFNLLGAA